MSPSDPFISEAEFAIRLFWPDDQVAAALAIAREESGLDPFALNDTTDRGPCGTPLEIRDGVQIVTERSVGLFQINACNFPDWEWQRFYNAVHNAGTAHLLWEQAGRSWRPWYFSAKKLGLI